MMFEVENYILSSYHWVYNTAVSKIYFLMHFKFHPARFPGVLDNVNQLIEPFV